MQLFFKILNGMANSVEPHLTAPSLVSTVSICHFVRNFVYKILGHLPHVVGTHYMCLSEVLLMRIITYVFMEKCEKKK